MHHPTTHAPVAPSRRLLTILLALAALTAPLAIAAPAQAAHDDDNQWHSGDCDPQYHDDWSNEFWYRIPLVSGDLGLPLWLGVQAWKRDLPPDWFGVCYGTGGPFEDKTIGGQAYAGSSVGNAAWPWVTVGFGNQPDGNSTLKVPVNTFVGLDPYTDEGGTDGGQRLTFTVDVGVCFGFDDCYVDPWDPTVQTTGVILGTITQTPAGSGGTSAAWSVSKLCLMVNGIEITNCDQRLDDTGVTTTGTSPVTSSASYGPCVVSICVPTNVNYLGTTGNKLATVYLPDGTEIPVNGVHMCIFQKDANTNCPY